MEKELTVNDFRRYLAESGREENLTMAENVDPSEVRAHFTQKEIRTVREQCVELLVYLQKTVNEILGESRMSKEKRNETEREFERSIKKVEEVESGSKDGVGIPRDLEQEIIKIVRQKGIESREDWSEYIGTMERDGEVLTEICDLLNTDVLQVKRKIAEMKTWKHDEAMDAHGREENSRCTVDGGHIHRLQMPSTGQTYVGRWRRRSPSLASTTPAREDTGATVSEHFLTYLRSMACTDPGVSEGPGVRTLKSL
ncbi:hypothetical protein GCK32_005971 [Trichostrongylus colubriformis]|uniref:Uncharacterized protein n=1 Tax=Trichostrongylus colubriformis TaxID=6319 RepID=A0AAN8FJW6_TRICO